MLENIQEKNQQKIQNTCPKWVRLDPVKIAKGQREKGNQSITGLRNGSGESLMEGATPKNYETPFIAEIS